MGRFDAAALLAAVDAGQPPSDTRSFGAKRTYFFEQGCVYFFLTAVCVFMATIAGGLGVLQVSEGLPTAPSAGTGSDMSAPQTWLWVMLGVLGLLAFVGLAVVSGARVLDAVRGLRSWRTQVLVLAPAGFVARTGTSPRAVFAVSYVALTAISLSIRHTRYETITDLLLTYRGSSSDAAATPRLEHLVWQVDPRFGPPDTIAQAILEAHTRATATRLAAE
jgi:hypothetical protein